jgi:hypothetical protein
MPFFCRFVRDHHMQGRALSACILSLLQVSLQTVIYSLVDQDPKYFELIRHNGFAASSSAKRYDTNTDLKGYHFAYSSE